MHNLEKAVSTKSTKYTDEIKKDVQLHGVTWDHPPPKRISASAVFLTPQ